jgi:uncharacterized protein (DUF433 family)
MPVAVRQVIGIPTYTIAEASNYLQIPTTILRRWVRGRRDARKQDPLESRRPIIDLPDKTRPRLSVTNLIEVHVLDAIKCDYGMDVQKMRATIDLVRNQTGVEHPLAFRSTVTDGIDLLLHLYTESGNLSSDRQLAIRAILNAYIDRIDWNESGFATRLYPFMRKSTLNELKVVVIDPAVSFRRPVSVGTGIPTAALAERYKAGESDDELAEDYDLKRTRIEDAIRFELTSA